MDTPKAIVFAAAIIAVAIVLANLHKVEPAGDKAYRINTLTGAVSICVALRCLPMSDIGK